MKRSDGIITTYYLPLTIPVALGTVKSSCYTPFTISDTENSYKPLQCKSCIIKTYKEIAKTNKTLYCMRGG